MVKKTRKLCKNCNGLGRIHQFCMKSYHNPGEQYDVFIDIVCCRCRGSGYVWQKEHKYDKKLS